MNRPLWITVDWKFPRSWNLYVMMVVFGGGALGELGHEGRSLIDGKSALASFCQVRL